MSRQKPPAARSERHEGIWDDEQRAVVEPSAAARLLYLGAALSETEASEITAEPPALRSIA